MTMFANRIKEERIQRGWTKVELGALSGVSPKTLAKYENNERMPNVETLIRIADAMDVSIDYLLGNSDYRNIVDYNCEVIKLKEACQAIAAILEKYKFSFINISGEKNLEEERLLEENRHLKYEIKCLQQKIDELIIENEYIKSLSSGI